jgi:hypothetical protein
MAIWICGRPGNGICESVAQINNGYLNLIGIAFFMKNRHGNLTGNILVLVVLVWAVSNCSNQENGHGLEVIWEDNRAVRLKIPTSATEGIPSDSLALLQIINNGSTQPMLGEFAEERDMIFFHPVVPFTSGMSYRVIYGRKIIGEFDIPVIESAKKPTLSIYPSSDTLPENVLKLYFQFSEPMVEGQSLRHISLHNKQGDTLAGIFLELQPELWSADGRLLTLWLDPGRIKRDLIPNKLMGNPLRRGDVYSVQVSGRWKSKDGLEIQENYSKTFVAHERDEKIPEVDRWTLSTPRRDSRSALSVQFFEPLDFSLIQSAIQVLDENQQAIPGQIQLMQEEKGIVFIPEGSWKKGAYQLQVQSRLEDLAGNNLSRPFDRDIMKGQTLREKDFYERSFVVE